MAGGTPANAAALDDKPGTLAGSFPLQRERELFGRL